MTIRLRTIRATVLAVAACAAALLLPLQAVRSQTADSAADGLSPEDYFLAPLEDLSSQAQAPGATPKALTRNGTSAGRSTTGMSLR